MPIPSLNYGYTRPHTQDDGTFERLKFVRPAEQAAQPVIDALIDVTESILAATSWFLGETDVLDTEYVSTRLYRVQSRICEGLRHFASVAARYHSGEFPADAPKVRELKFQIKYQLRLLRTIADDLIVDNAARSASKFFHALDAPDMLTLSDAQWSERVKEHLEDVLAAVETIARHLRTIEDNRHVAQMQKRFGGATRAEVAALLADATSHVEASTQTVVAHAAADTQKHVTAEADRQIAAKAPKRKRKFAHEGNGLRGPKTKMMVRQRKAFFEFLKTHPEGKGHSRITRAHELWMQHPEWDKAKSAQGDAKGYSSHKALSAAQ